MTTTQPLDGAVTVVTGASSGIGRSYARTLSEAGATVVLVARSAERLAAVADGLPGRSSVVPGDLSDTGFCQEVADRVLADHGRVDVLLSNAGVYVPGDFAETDLGALEQLVGVNVLGAMAIVRTLLPAMVAAGRGDVVLTSSVSGHQSIHWEPVYSASKHAVQAFTHGLRRQLVGTGVRAGAVAPGVVLNELWGVDEGADVAAEVAAGRGITSEDVAEAVLWMLTRPRHVTIRDLVMLPANQEI